MRKPLETTSLVDPMNISLVMLTGQSGSGKSTALRTLEDQGYLCVDNIPLGMIETLTKSAQGTQGSGKIAVVVDVRQSNFIEQAPKVVAKLREGSAAFRLVYLEARKDILLRRYSETRRSHPLDQGAGLHASISTERELLAPLRELADDTIDTSGLSPHALRAGILRQLVNTELGDDLGLAIVSFGFKYGLPLDADIVLDVRFLPNPYFVAELRSKTGLQPEVREYVLQQSAAQEFVERTFDYLQFLLPQYQKEGKRYLTVAVGCTGGQHRSVSIAWRLNELFSKEKIRVDLQHRDAGQKTQERTK